MTALRRYQPDILIEPAQTWLAPRSSELFERLFGDALSTGWDGATDVYETEREVIVQCALPGFRPEQIEVTEQHGILTIRATRNDERREQRAGLRYESRQAQVVQRSLRLPVEVDATQAQATLQHGLLTIRLPKARSSAARRIPIRSRRQRIRVGTQARSWLQRLIAWARRPRLHLTHQRA
ncbi:Hsp20/alpha crystallin family protein [Kallotenue papyrolyticum]|uniref:Hsp20/alpha crystallin family protein n=1 Tax=Kallotenue papyrolyticum TaxID=1325125 RepID=UPI000492BA10|nr:Hsp20/alpha crystallin family protein [Kallotenue papyrolyticum]